jgi:23S rRNA G2069 N7-methylase RlmK/C1962 C5-methylase RlmI
MAMSEKNHKRVNVMITEEQYREVSDQGLNLSGLIRDLLGDHFSNDVISLQVSEDTRKVYDLLVSNTGATDRDIEVHIRRALANLLAEKIEEMHTLRTRLLEDD